MPPELIFILVLIVFSVLENALKAKKKKGGPLGGPPGTELPPGWPPPDADRPERREAEGERARTIPAKKERASEMVPEELWEEIAALARGDVEETLRRRRARARAEAEEARGQRSGRTVPGATRTPGPVPEAEPASARSEEELPDPSAERGERVLSAPKAEGPQSPAPSRAPRSREPRSREGHRSRQLREGAGAYKSADLAEARQERRAARIQAHAAARGRAPLGEEGTGGKASRGNRVRTEFRGARSLRLAVVAREVLGRPLALREYGDEEMWSE